MARPALSKNISLKDFKEFYWLKEELTDFSKKIGIATSGSKIELSNKIEQYLLNGRIVSNYKNATTIKSKFDWNNDRLSKLTVITDNYTNTENVRLFFKTELGSHFSFNVKFMNWMKKNEGQTLKEAIEQWKKLKEIKKDKNYKTEIEAQFEYNRYMRAFLSDNPNLSSKDAMTFWKIKKGKRGPTEYEPTDLELT